MWERYDNIFYFYTVKLQKYKGQIMCNFRFLLLLVFVVLLNSCSKYPADVKHALKLAGDNRIELEKVLEHYSKDVGDSLKFKAACFLIGNMLYHCSMYSEEFDSFKSFIVNNDIHQIQEYKEKNNLFSEPFKSQYDVHVIKSDYLIRNIDFSFKLWNEPPWNMELSFHDFCEELLPYRIGVESLEDWKEVYYKEFYHVIVKLPHNNDPVEASRLFSKYLKEQGWKPGNYSVPIPNYGALTLLYSRYGNCIEAADLIAYALMSVGIPAGIDSYKRAANTDGYAHFWNYIHSPNGDTFVINDFELQGPDEINRECGKIFRKSYALQKESLPVKFKNIFIPDNLKDIFLKDISSAYFPETNISIDIDPAIVQDEKVLYLCILNNKEWVPIAWAEPEKNTAKFKNIQQNILYLLASISKSGLTPISNPFILESNEKPNFLRADSGKTQNMVLTRKYSTHSGWPAILATAINGKFQGANKPDFSDAVTLYTIPDTADFTYVNIYLDNPSLFKYVRYIAADGSPSNMAEIKFVSNGQLLKGEIIGTIDSQGNELKRTKDKVFDDDPLTFFENWNPNPWVGLKFEKASQIEEIRYLFRNDDNNVRPGDLYELFFWDNKQWVTVGKKSTDMPFLHYENIPSQALYLLRNYTRGKEERPFTYQNGKQKFW